MEDMDFGSDGLDLDGGNAGGGDLFGGDTGGGDGFDSGGYDILGGDIPEDTNSDFTVGTDGNTTNIETNPETIADLENQGYEMNMEVTESSPEGKSNAFADTDTSEPNDFDEDNLDDGMDDDASREQTEPEEEIPEDTASEISDEEEMPPDEKGSSKESNEDKPDSVRGKLDDMKKENPGDSKASDYNPKEPPVLKK